MSTLSAGQKIQQYRIESVLGSGGFGITYLAKDEALDKHFAIKEYFPADFAIRDHTMVRARTGQADDFAWGKRRFLDEARSLALFNHPNIVGVVQIIEANQTAYIVLEYLQGQSLKEWAVGFEGGPGQERLDSIVEPVLDALALMHRNNILHRDLAPDNIFVRNNGTPVILDLGSAREVLVAKSRTVSAVVKSGYSPAEQYSTRGSAQGPWSDIYSFAATLYYCVAGHPPEEATERLISDQNKPAAEYATGEYRESFLRGIDWGLRLIPNDRPQSVDEWRSALLEGGGSPPVVASAAPDASALVGEEAAAKQSRAFSTRQKAAAFAAVVAIAGAAFGIYQNQKWFGFWSANEAVIATTATANNSASQSRDRSASTPNPDEKKPPIRIRSESVRGLTNLELCRAALNGRNWNESAATAEHVEEAQSRGLSTALCIESIALSERIAAIRDLPMKQLCQIALNGRTVTWEPSEALRYHVDEARRRGLTEGDCQRLGAVEAQPPTRTATLATPPPPRTESRNRNDRIQLGIDRTVGSVNNWTIGINQSLNGCIASVEYGDQTKMWFGYTAWIDAKDNHENIFLAFSNPKWSSIQIGAIYKINLEFGNGASTSAGFGGVPGIGEKGVFYSDSNRSIINYLAYVNEIALYLNGNKMAQLTLDHFADAVARLDQCQTALRQNR